MVKRATGFIGVPVGSKNGESGSAGKDEVILWILCCGLDASRCACTSSHIQTFSISIRLSHYDRHESCPETHHNVREAVAGSGVPRIKVDGLGRQPRAILQAELKRTHSNQPVWRWAQHRQRRHNVMLSIDPENSEGFSVHVRIPQSSGFYDRSDFVRLKVESDLENGINQAPGIGLYFFSR